MMSGSGLHHTLALPHKVTNGKITLFISQLTTVSHSIVNKVRKRRGEDLWQELNCVLQITSEIPPMCCSGDLDQDLPLQTLPNPKKYSKSLHSIRYHVAKLIWISTN